MRCLVVLLWLTAISLRAQTPTPSDSTRADSTAAPTPPAPPTPEQKRFLDGLRTATRGVAQLKDGVSRVTRARRDSLAQRRAGRYLAALCGSGRAFLRRGRPRMDSTAYEDSAGVKARKLLTQVDTLIAYAPTCEQKAAGAPDVTATELGKRMKNYDAALRDFRVAIGLPVRDDTSKTVKRQ